MSRILVADDSWIARTNISTVLKKAGYDVDVAENGRQVVDMVEKHLPDLILLDLLMPEMSGIEAMAVLKERGVDVPIIIVSADIQATTRENCFELGATEFMKKPPVVDEMMKLIEQTLNKGE